MARGFGCALAPAWRMAAWFRCSKFAARDRGWIRSRKPGAKPIDITRAWQELRPAQRRALRELPCLPSRSNLDPYFWAERMKAATSLFSSA